MLFAFVVGFGGRGMFGMLCWGIRSCACVVLKFLVFGDCCCVICFFARNPKADCITIGLLLRTVLLLIGSCCRILSMLFDIAHPTGRLERRPERAKWASGLDIRGRAVSRGDIEPILPMGVLTFDREVEVMEERESLERRGEGGVEVSEVLRGEDT